MLMARTSFAYRKEDLSTVLGGCDLVLSSLDNKTLARSPRRAQAWRETHLHLGPFRMSPSPAKTDSPLRQVMRLLSFGILRKASQIAQDQAASSTFIFHSWKSLEVELTRLQRTRSGWSSSGNPPISSVWTHAALRPRF